MNVPSRLHRNPSLHLNNLELVDTHHVLSRIAQLDYIESHDREQCIDSDIRVPCEDLEMLH